LKNPSIAKHFTEDHQNQLGTQSDEEEKFNMHAGRGISKGILEIIKDDDEEKIRTSSNDIQIND
jgi:hypothetical protein